MQSIDTHGSFEDAITKSSAPAQELARQVHELIADVYPNAVEVPWPKQQVVGYGVGPKKMSEHFCYIGAFKNHVNLGFNYGADLPDPEGLLEGTGKLFRHVKINSPQETERPAVRRLVEAAVEEREKALGVEK
jgi:hypothetical protein